MKKENLDVVEDLPEKRITIVTGDRGDEKFKAIYLKHKQRLKIIHFSHRQIFNKVLNS